MSKVRLCIFVLLAVIQVGAPMTLLVRYEAVLHSGTEYKLRTEPMDPYDPLRGKYVALNFIDETCNVGENTFKGDDIAYLELKTGLDGFSKPFALHKINSSDQWLKVTVESVYSNTYHFKYPFDRFYLEEKKAPVVEKLYNERSFDNDRPTYILIKIKNNRAVITDLYINNKSYKDYFNK